MFGFPVVYMLHLNVSRKSNLIQKETRDNKSLTSVAGVTEESSVLLLVKVLPLLPLAAQLLKNPGPGHVVVELQGLVDVVAGNLRALMTAPEGTCAVVPGFVIAFLGVALGPLGSVQEKLHNVSVILY